MNDVEQRNERLFNAIEDVIAHMHKKIPPDERMAYIRTHFPSPSFFIESNSFSLQRIGLPRLDAFYFTLIPAIARRVGQERYGIKPRLNKLSLMSEYLKGLFIGVHVECFYSIMLDSRGYLIDARLIRKGTTDSAPFYLNEALSLAVQRRARAVVLCHNHPGGTLRPSKEDIACTLEALRALMALGIPMLDHVIIACDQAVSMRDCGVIPSKLWALQSPRSKLCREWVDVDLLEGL